MSAITNRKRHLVTIVYIKKHFFPIAELLHLINGYLPDPYTVIKRYDFFIAGINTIFNKRHALFGIDGMHRFIPLGDNRDDHVMVCCEPHQIIYQAMRQMRHIAAAEKDALGPGMYKGGVQASQGAEALNQIWNDVIGKKSILAGLVSYNKDLWKQPAKRVIDILNQSFTAIRVQGFVLFEPAAVPTCSDIGSYIHSNKDIQFNYLVHLRTQSKHITK